MTIGIAIFNMIFLQGISLVAARQNVTSEAPVNIKMEVLSAGFDLAFFGAFILAIIIVILSFLAKQEVHPDYLEDDSDSEIIAGMI
jgi:uncharacterized membrane protein